MTLAKVAAIAGVSVSTASKAFSGSREISDETREIVYEAAKKCGCYEKYKKQRYDRRVFAVVIPETESEYYHKFALALEKLIEKNGDIMLMSSSHFNDERTRELFRYYTEFCRVDGIITVGSTRLIDNAENFPAVAIGRVCGGVEAIGHDIRPGISAAFDLLLKYGHERIGFIGEGLTVEKEAIVLEEAEKHGVFMRSGYIHRSDKRFAEAGCEGFRAFAELDEPPSAVICAYDYIALGVIDEAHRRGMKIPEDLSVIGMDNIGFTALDNISLTTVSTDVDKLCEAALSRLYDRFKSRIPSKNKRLDTARLIPSELIIRGSVSYVGKGSYRNKA